MADRFKDAQLRAGDIVSLRYRITADNEVQEALIIHQIKSTLSADKRFNYQGSSIITVGDETLQRDVRLLTINIQVAKHEKAYSRPVTAESGTSVRTTKQTGPFTGQPPASAGLTIFKIVALITGATVAWSTKVIYDDYTINQHPIAATVNKASSLAAVVVIGGLVAVFLLGKAGRHATASSDG